MNEKIKWLQELLTDEEREIVRRGGWGKERGLGPRPCVFIIDAQYNYIGRDAPILKQMDEWPSGCGTEAWKAVRKSQKLIEIARSKNIPLIYTRQVQKNILVREKFDSFGAKMERPPQQYIEGARGTEIIEDLMPKEGDLIIDKSYASAFFATPLISFLIKLRIDSILMIGGTTSGCVRSTAVDAAARNYNVGVVMDCIFDRIKMSHRAALLDMWMKYADILTVEEALNYLRKLDSLNGH